MLAKGLEATAIRKECLELLMVLVLWTKKSLETQNKASVSIPRDIQLSGLGSQT